MLGTQEEFNFLLEKIQRNKGADFTLYRPGTLKRRLDSRIKTVGCKDYSEYISFLNKNPLEYDALIAEITINVSEFFRNPETFEQIERGVIPEIVKARENQGSNNIRVWSAGTSNGQEAYSLAILFLELLGKKIEEFNIVIYATDIDPDCIKKAQEGIYLINSLKEVSRNRLIDYFEGNNGEYKVKNRVKSLVNFKVHNLVSDGFFRDLDLILCRNVVIYFTKPLQEMIYRNFAKALNQNGFLVLGKVESLWSLTVKYFTPWDNRERIYKKL